ncbi:MAG TPA: copper transporter [Actinomycetota bacterium]|nr:copper transporter [Actinomycetota bacterium]
MVDFRYHLISLIAVLLALAVGILAGSGFLGGPLLEQIKGDVQELRETNSALRDEISVLSDRVEQDEAFARLADQYLTDRVLEGRRIVMFQFAASDGALIDGIKRAITGADGQIATEITIAEKFALTSQPARDELALALGSLAAGEEELRVEAATLLGERSAAAAERASSGSSSDPAAERARELTAALERAEFIGVAAGDPENVVPPDAMFVVVGGGTGRVGYDAAAFAVTLAESLAELEGPVIAVESQTSVWGLVRSLRSDVEARAIVSSVDNGNTTIGRIATVLGLQGSSAGQVGHYGFEAGRTAVIPARLPNE